MLEYEGSAPCSRRGPVWRAASELLEGHQLRPWPMCITTQLLFGLILFLFLLPAGVDTKGTPNKPAPVIPGRPTWDLAYHLELLEHFSSSQNQECSHYNLLYNSFCSMYLKGQLNTLQILLHVLDKVSISQTKLILFPELISPLLVSISHFSLFHFSYPDTCTFYKMAVSF